MLHSEADALGDDDKARLLKRGKEGTGIAKDSKAKAIVRKLFFCHTTHSCTAGES